MGAALRVAMGLTVVLAVAGMAAADEVDQASQPATASSAPTLPSYLKDRDTGVPISMSGTYIRRGELIVYPFYEYYHDNNLEYAPEEFGAVGTTDFRGRYRANEGILLLAYGLGENWAVEFETAVIKAQFEKSASDASALPSKIEESGLGDVEGQIRWRWKKETEHRPEWFSYGEVVFPHAKNKVLIGTPDWEMKLGTGMIRGFTWGTLTARAAIEYTAASSSKFDLGEYALEYLKRLSPHWRVYVGIEGSQDELSLITEAQWHISRNVMLKLNNGLGLTSKATDWAPEVGILFTFPTR